MARALIVTPRLPWPLDDGGRIGMWQSVWCAARVFETTVLAMVPRGEETTPLPGVFGEHGIEVVRVPHRPPGTPLAAWSGLVGRWPYTLARYRCAAFSARLRALVAERHFAFALVNHLHMATYVDDLGETPMVLREHNVEHRWMSRYAAGAGATPRALYAFVQAARLRRAEAELCRRSKLVLAIQPEEQKQLQQLVPGTRVEHLPIGVDFARYHEPKPASPPVVLLLASFGWEPNVRGALRFLHSGWPKVRARNPDARLRLVGRDLPAELEDAARAAGAEAVGYVSSVAEAMASARVLVVPLWVGAGARVKIIEALAARLPVVSTAIGAEGLGLEGGRHLLLGESPESLAEEVNSLLRDPERASRLAAEGFAVARERWSLSATCEIQNRLCREIMRSEN